MPKRSRMGKVKYAVVIPTIKKETAMSINRDISKKLGYLSSVEKINTKMIKK